MELKIEYVDIDTLKEYQNNAKIHTEEQVEQIKKSIKEFSMLDPIAIWNNEIVEGHGRLMACRDLGLKKVPVIRLDNLSDEQRRAYMLVHNKLTMNTGFDFSALENQLSQIENINMLDYGFAKIQDIENQLDDFFTPDEPKEEKFYITFVISKPIEKQALKELLYYLDEQELSYAEK